MSTLDKIIHRLGTFKLLALAAAGVAMHTGALAADVVASDAAYAKAQPILQTHCLSCHSSKPAWPGYRVAPAGVLLETPEQLRQFAPRVLALVTNGAMPVNNLSHMSDTERAELTAIIRDAGLQER